MICSNSMASKIVFLVLILTTGCGSQKLSPATSLPQTSGTEWEEGASPSPSPAGPAPTLSGKQKELLYQEVEQDVANGVQPTLVNGQPTMVITPSDLSQFSIAELFVVYLYRRYLGRNPEPGGLKHWTNVLMQKGAIEAASGVLGSQEFYNQFGNDVGFVSALYYFLLGRTADTDGMNGWVQKLQQGMSRQDVAKGFLNSPEFVGMKKI